MSGQLFEVFVNILLLEFAQCFGFAHLRICIIFFVNDNQYQIFCKLKR